MLDWSTKPALTGPDRDENELERFNVGNRFMAGIAGAVGIVVAFGVAELFHGLYESVPSVLVAIAQRIAELTPGGIVTTGIELLGTADIPTLIATVVLGSLAICAGLAILSLRSQLLALVGVGALAVVAIASSLAETFVAVVPTIVADVAALALGVVVAETLLRAAGLRAPEPAEPAPAPAPSGGDASPVVRSREAYATGGMSVGRGSFLALGGAATVAGLVALGHRAYAYRRCHRAAAQET